MTEQTTAAEPKARKSRASSEKKPRATSKNREPKEADDLKSSLKLQLAFWPDEVRGVPNAALRGALFSISKERSMAKKLTEIATVDGYSITFKGERFNQRDLDLWEMLLHIGRNTPCGQYVEVVASRLLRALGRGTGGADYEELNEDMARLRAGSVQIKSDKKELAFTGGLIVEFYRDTATQHYAVLFSEKMLKLYESGYTHVDWEQRRKLKNNSLAQWLHGFYATHAAPLRYKVETIRDLCGSTTDRLTDFRKALRTALKRLEEVGAITSSSIDPKTDLITVRRKGSMSQQRHLEAKQATASNVAFLSSETGTLSGFDSH